MIDCQRIISILFHASTSKRFKEIKSTLIPICSKFSASDVILFANQQNRDAGPSVAYVANQTLSSKEIFHDNVRMTHKEFREVQTDGARCFIVITDYDDILLQNMLERLGKFETINYIKSYDSMENLSKQINSIIGNHD